LRFLLDTDAVNAFHKNHRFSEQVRRHDRTDVAISAIVLHELLFGAYKSFRRDHNLRMYASLPFAIVPFDSADADASGRVRAYLQARGTPIGAYDLLIAGQALARDLTLVTHNVDEFSRVPGLKLEDWQA
jgi:tRNA(fMet)-specific endonuclease VapC